MALQTINLGTVVNDGTGDDLRTAFEKVVYNFSDINSRLADTTTAENVGDNGEGIFKDKIDGTNLRFKKIIGGDNIVLAASDDTITVNFSIESNISFDERDLTNVGNINVLGNIQLDGESSKLVGNVQGNVMGNLAGTVYAPVGTFGLQGDVVGRNPDAGELDPLYSPARVDGVSILDLNKIVNTFDYGNIGSTFTNPITYLLDQLGTDMGTIMLPAPFTIDGGTL